MRKLLVLMLLLPWAVMAQVSHFDIQGHRGSRGSVPPGNTLPSYQHAINIGVDTLEGDMRLTQDGNVVMNHDPKVDARCLWQGQGPAPSRTIRKLSLEALQQWDCHPNISGIQAPPTLRQLMQLAENAKSRHGAKVHLSLEMKENAHEDITAFFKALNQLNARCDNCWQGRLIIQSFDWDGLHFAKQRPSQVAFRSAFLFDTAPKNKVRPKTDNDDQALLRYVDDMDILSPDVAHTTPALLAFARRHGKQIITWTVNDQATAKRLQKMGIDGIITDYPPLL